MSTMPCRFDAATTRAARTHEWSADLRAHGAACPDCRQTAAFVEQLVSLAAVTAAAAPPPRSPYALWLRAEYARRARVRARLARRQLAAGVAVPLLALIGFTLVRGTEGWARLSQSAAAPPSPQIVSAVVLGLVVTVWVMLVGRADDQASGSTLEPGRP
jgi:hypothetical protein